jgi:hypothetical protein
MHKGTLYTYLQMADAPHTNRKRQPMYSVTVEGSPNRFCIAPRTISVAEGVMAVLETIKSIDRLHADAVDEAASYWTVEQIADDLNAYGACEILISGGYYVVVVKSCS